MAADFGGLCCAHTYDYDSSSSCYDYHFVMLYVPISDASASIYTSHHPIRVDIACSQVQSFQFLISLRSFQIVVSDASIISSFASSSSSSDCECDATDLELVDILHLCPSVNRDFDRLLGLIGF
eukprot:532085_1